MDQNFLQWAIPNYFIKNYLDPSFHTNCPKNNPANLTECFQEDKFIQHYQSYLNKWSTNRGKWINLFSIQQDLLLGINSQNTYQNKDRNQVNNFIQLLAHLKLKNEQIYFVGFLTRFYRLVCLDTSQVEKQEIIRQITKIYFKYRIELSMKNVNDLSQPQQVVQLVKSIVQNAERPVIDIELLQKIAIQCQFQNIFYQIRGKNNKILKNQAQKPQVIMTPIKKVVSEEFKQKSVSQRMNSLSQTSPSHDKIQQNKNNFTAINENQAQKKQLSKQQSAKKMQQALDKCRMRNLQKTRQIIKTTRHSNFKGTFIKKPSNYSYQAVQKTQQQVYYDMNANNRFIMSKRKKIEKMEENQDFDFLCDKSM